MGGVLKKCWQRGIEPFLFFGEFTAHRIDRSPLTEADRIFIRMNKMEIIEEITILSSGTRISGEDFYGSSLMADAVGRAKKRNKHE